MGAVGSNAIARFLRNNRINCFHGHWLTESSIDLSEFAQCGTDCLSPAGANSLPYVNLRYRFLRNKLFLGEGTYLTKPTKIITMFREPIDYLISQYLRAFTRGLDDLIKKKYGTLNLESAVMYFLECVDIYSEAYIGKVNINDESYKEVWGNIEFKDAYTTEFLWHCRLPLIWFVV